jgi:ABC-type transport system involved in multi-copper enzyme maturation permease subunit
VTVSPRRVRAIFRKELREYRRHTSIVVSVAIFPLIFLIQPLVLIFVAPSSTANTLAQDHLLLYMLAIPVLAPAMLAAYAVAGERQQGTLEPVLTTPVRREEFLLGKALAVLAPSVAIAYAMYAVFLAFVLLFARPAVASALIRAPDILIQILLTPLLAAWSTWVALAISTRSSDVRVAQQLSLLGNVPVVMLTSLIAFNVIHVTLGLALGLGALLLLVDASGWRIVSPMFNRERLITGTR